MLSRVLFLQISLMLFGLTTSFINVQVQRNMQLSGNKWMKNEVSSQLYAVNKDLFSDDLFDDDEDDKKTLPKQDLKDPAPPTRKYLDKDWKLNPNDEKDFKNLKSGGGKAIERTEKIPMFALMYKFRKEYFDFGAESVMADHKGYCSKFTRLASTNFINIAKARGAVVLWLGESESDLDATRAEAMTFIEEDPLIEKDIVESWDLIDLTPKGSLADLPPRAAARTK